MGDMNLDIYERVLLDLRTSFSARASGDAANGRQQNLGGPGDSGDATVTGESDSED